MDDIEAADREREACRRIVEEEIEKAERADPGQQRAWILEPLRAVLAKILIRSRL
jgi:hypothetical protein